MDRLHGFDLLHEQEIPELKTIARLYRHAQTGAELLSLINDDENKVFGITFRTPPRDSTGVAHILEHSVLCGSRKYPVKEPFVELLKGSLKTFLNAFTYPDKTCYPVASQNVQDFYNLVDVYLDAVFYPRITPEIFQQEGWHYDLEDSSQPIIYKGVVFNEMKGAYSSPDTLLAEHTQQSLFPDTTYGLDSGGNPRIIPRLSYEQFKSFHEDYYHPSNARIFFYGDDEPDRRLALLDAYLREFEPRAVDSTVALQSPFASPRRISRHYAAGENDGEERARPMVTVNWLLPETADPVANLSLVILSYVLLGMPGSPLRKALIESGLGEDITGTGLENELRQMFFSTGLKGLRHEDGDQVESLILKTLSELETKGIDPNSVEAAVNTIEFRLRENNTGSFPRGLALMLRSLTTWLYGHDPLALLCFERPLAELKSRIAADPGVFSGLIRRHFIENPHRTTVLLLPDPELRHREEAAEREELDGARQSLSPRQVEEIVTNTLSLRRMQETPDPPEALATIPTLRLEDLDKTNKTIPLSVLTEDPAPLLHHDLFTNGILYLDIGFDLHTIPRALLPYVPLFSRGLTEMGTERDDYVALSQRISRKTGGIWPEIFTGTTTDSREGIAWLIMRSKATRTRAEDLFDILHDLVSSTQWDNRERFRQMVLEEKARHERRIIPNGHQIVSQRIRAEHSESDWVTEQTSGLSYLFFVRDLAQRVEDDWPRIRESLKELQALLLDRGRLLFNVTCSDKDWSALDSAVSDFMNGLTQSRAAPLPRVDWAPDRPPSFEGLVIPSQVNYVGKGINAYQLGHEFHGAMLVAAGYLRSTWLWERVRVQGGAYGAFSQFDRHTGNLTIVSYRDPNCLKTLEVFDQAAEFLRSTDFSDEEIVKGIIGTIGLLDAHLLPDARGYRSMLRYLLRDDEVSRQEMRDQVLSTTAADFRRMADVFSDLKHKGIVKVLGAKPAVDELVRELPHPVTVTPVL
ncbi:MAG: insulinase family protein [Syntrophobacteraceae bacterium]